MTRIKSVTVGPKKGWSKVTPKVTSEKKSKKRKMVESSDYEYENVETDVPHIPVSAQRKSAGKKIGANISDVPTDNISFHYPEYAQRWKYVFQRRLALERELGKDIQDIKEVVDLIKHAGLESTVTNLGDCFEKLVKEFLVNIPDDCNDPMSPDYHTVYVRGRKVKFSLAIINKWLGIDTSPCTDGDLNYNKVCKVLTANHIKIWPRKGTISAINLSVKYAVLKRTGAANWVPTTHSSDIAMSMDKVIYCIDTKTKMNIGAYIFDQTVRHGRSDAVKLPIAFPTLLSSIILDQQPDILTIADAPKKRESPLSLHFKLFGSHHVADLVEASAPASTSTAPTTGSGFMSRKEIVAAMQETCKFLDARKFLFERMILALENEEAGNEEVGVAEDDGADNVAEEEEEDDQEEDDIETDA
jgi:hypothetical protein